MISGRVNRAHNELRAKAIQYVTKNSDRQFVILNKVDFWPTTGTFIFHGTNETGKGLFNLLRKLGY